MKCQSCGYPASEVIRSEINDLKNYIKRRRQCLRCRNRFTTEENYRPLKPQNDLQIKGRE